PATARAHPPPVSSSYRVHRARHSFPTRRSSDLDGQSHSSRASPDNLRLLRLAYPQVPLREQTHLFLGIAPLHHAGDEVVVLLLRSEEHTSELQSRENLVCRLLLEKKKT